MQNPPPGKNWYLPTHPVENPNKPGKVRRVANAASKYKNESLNSNLLTGPDLLANLLELILRLIRLEDQSALRFLWMSDNYVLQYQYTRLIFGANCYTVLHHIRIPSLRSRSRFPIPRRIANRA